MLTEELRRELLAAIQSQIDTANPPATGLTLARLEREGATRAQALDLIVFALLTEMNEVARPGGSYDQARYERALAELRVE
jgi:hypothetical protein